MPSTSRSRLLRTSCLTAFGFLAIVSCSSEDAGEAITFDSYLAALSYDYDPAASLGDLADRSTVVAKATLLDVEDGRSFGEPGLESSNPHVNLVFQVDDGSRYYVELPRSPLVSFEKTRAIFPIGTSSVIYLQPNNDPDEDWFNSRDDGNEWFFTTPQGWILDDPEGTTRVPLEDEPGFKVSDDQNLDSWLPPEGEKRP